MFVRPRSRQGRTSTMPSEDTMDPPSSTERSPLLYHGGFFPTHPPIVKVSDHEQRAAASHQQEVEHQDRISPPESEPWTRPAFLTASLCTSFLILFAIADLLRWVSTTRLLELGICREYYHNHTRDHSSSSNIPIPDSPDSPDCTHPAIQSRLATLRGTLSALEAFLSLCLTLPYGLLVPRIPGGERSLAGLNVLGYLLSCGWLMLVCSSSYRYPDNTFAGGVHTTIWAPVLRVLVGGGAPVLSSLVYAIAARGVPKQKRASVFMIFVGAQLGAGVVGMLGAAALLDRGREMAAMGLNFPLGVGCLVVLWCLPGSRKGERRGGGGGGEGEGLLNGGERESDGDGDVNKHVTMTLSLSSLLSSGKRSTAVLSELLAHDRRALVLLATIPIAKCINPVEELMVQYIPKRFDISLASASRSLTISTLESLLLLLFILPFLKSAAQTRFHIPSTKVDLYIVRSGFLLQGLGCVIMAMSPTLVVFILGLMVLALGCSTRAALQSLLTDLVGKTEHIAVLYTVVALGDGIGSAAGALLLNRALAIGISWDDKKYMGLPFVVAAVLFLGAFGGAVSVPVRMQRRRRRVSSGSCASGSVEEGM